MNQSIASGSRRLLCFALLFFFVGRVKAQISNNVTLPEVNTVRELRDVIGAQPGRVCAFVLEGIVLRAEGDSGIVFLQDSTEVAALDLELGGMQLEPGQRIRICGTNYVAKTEVGLSLGKSPVVNADNLHSTIERWNSIQLAAGWHPIRVTWFNQSATALCEVTYQGSGLSRQRIPDTALFRRAIEANTTRMQPGLDYRYHEGRWNKLPNFATLVPRKTGVVSNFDIGVKTNEENVGIEFSGFLNLPTTGEYQFYLRSDDGGQLFLDHEPPTVTVIGKTNVPASIKISPGDPLMAEHGGCWAETEGVVAFFGSSERGATFDLTSGANSMRVEVLHAKAESPRSILNSRVRVHGFCPEARNVHGQTRASQMMVLGWKDIEIIQPPPEQRISSNFNATNELRTLTTALEVQQLSREEAQREYPVKIQGVVTWVSDDYRSFVIQDDTRAVYVWVGEISSEGLPKLGDYSTVTGVSQPADFSPIVVLKMATVLWKAEMPKPVIPARDQLLNGSLDAQYVEIRGLVIAAENDRITLLASDGTVDLRVTPMSLPAVQILNSVVRVRGCLLMNWDKNTHRVVLDQPLQMRAATVSVDVPPPKDLFAVDLLRVRELMQFDVRSDTFRRVRVSGQIIGQSDGLYYLADDTIGLRFRPVAQYEFVSGDLVEVAGLVEFAGAGPILRQAVARKAGHASVPQPRPLVLDSLGDSYDSTLVWTEGTLVDLKKRGDEQILEMQTGFKTFLARLKSSQPVAESWPIGSRLKLTGVFSALDGNRNIGRDINSFELILNRATDVQILARPPWWTLRRLFILVTFLTTGLALAFFWIRSLRRQVERRTTQLQLEIGERERAEKWRAIEQERSRIARDLHDDLGSDLTEISMLATAVPGQQPGLDAVGKRLREIADKSRSMISALDGVVWVVNARNDNLSSLVEYLASYAEEFLAKAGVACRVELPEAYQDQVIVSEIRHDVLLSVREALNNAVRHGRPTEVLLRMIISAAQFEVVIQDNGRGFEPGETKGDGLENMKLRMAKLNGGCQMQSGPGRGTTVTMTIPLRN